MDGARRHGEVVWRDGEYVYVRLRYRNILAQFYDCELEPSRARRKAK